MQSRLSGRAPAAQQRVCQHTNRVMRISGVGRHSRALAPAAPAASTPQHGRPGRQRMQLRAVQAPQRPQQQQAQGIASGGADDLESRKKQLKITVFSSARYVVDFMELPIKGSFPNTTFVEVGSRVWQGRSLLQRNTSSVLERPNNTSFLTGPSKLVPSPWVFP